MQVFNLSSNVDSILSPKQVLGAAQEEKGRSEATGGQTPDSRKHAIKEDKERDFMSLTQVDTHTHTHTSEQQFRTFDVVLQKHTHLHFQHRFNNSILNKLRLPLTLHMSST